MLMRREGKSPLKTLLSLLPNAARHYKTKRLQDDNQSIGNIHCEKYQWSDLNHQEKLLGVKKLSDFMDRERPFLDPKLTLSSLAAMLATPVKDLSQIINECCALNFCNFVNRYRIELAKELLTQAEKKRIIDIQLEVGFSSKSTFNTTFRKFTGLTPSAFRRQYRKAPNQMVLNWPVLNRRALNRLTGESVTEAKNPRLD